MALRIEDPEIDRLARELAALSGVPVATAVREAIQERLAVLRTTTAGLDEVVARGRARATIDARPEDEVLGSDT